MMRSSGFWVEIDWGHLPFCTCKQRQTLGINEFSGEEFNEMKIIGHDLARYSRENY
jgi:hypothetical protein